VLAIRVAIEKVRARFDAAYWLKKDSEGGFPEDFHQALARDRRKMRLSAFIGGKLFLSFTVHRRFH
jgi:hypothetical protein